jgi:hypothetical protein
MILLALFVPFIYFCFPETAQLSLEEVDSKSSIYLRPTCIRLTVEQICTFQRTFRTISLAQRP